MRYQDRRLCPRRRELRCRRLYRPPTTEAPLMANIRQVGGGAAGHIYLIGSDGTVWDSSPTDHSNALAAQPIGPVLAQQQAAANQIATNIASTMNGQVDASELYLVFDWATGNATEVRVG